MAHEHVDESAAVATAQLGLAFPAVAANDTTATVARKTPSKPVAKTAPERRASAGPRANVTAEQLAQQQRSISVSEFFAKNRHLLGFDNKRKALLTTIKEAVDNSLDACEESGILPDIHIAIEQLSEERFRVIVRDNGPGIVKAQIPNVFGKLLYGSKFHRLKMSRGQQGIGISAAGMYGLITTGKPVQVISRTGPRAKAHLYKLAIDTKKNRPDIIADETVDVDWHHGTEVIIDLVASYNKGRQSVDEYLEQTAIANPHARIEYRPPIGEPTTLERGIEELPDETKEIKPHPYGIELGMFLRMLKDTEQKKLGPFLTREFSRVSAAAAKNVCEKAGHTTRSWVSSIETADAEALYKALQESRLKAPAMNCLAPIGAEAILTGLLKGIKAEFYTASTRPPSVYRGNPFQIEVGLAYGGELGADRNERDGSSDKNGDAAQTRVIRFANRVPLLYQQSSCCTFKAVVETRWNNYGVSQSSGALPRAPMVVLIHMASVWVPFISEGKEAIADYDEIRKEVKLALAECGRRLATLLKRKRKKSDYSKRRDVFTRYIGEVVEAVGAMTDEVNKRELHTALVDLAQHYTAQADMEFDEHGKVIKKKPTREERELQDTIVVDRDAEAPDPQMLFRDGGLSKRSSGKRASPKRRAAKRASSKKAKLKKPRSRR